MVAMIYIYENREIYKKDKDFSQLIMTSNEYIKLYEKELKNVELDIDIYENIEDIEDIENLENVENIDENIDIDLDIDINEYLENINKNINEKINEKINEETNIISEYKKDLASDQEIGKDVQLT